MALAGKWEVISKGRIKSSNTLKSNLSLTNPNSLSKSNTNSRPLAFIFYNLSTTLRNVSLLSRQIWEVVVLQVSFLCSTSDPEHIRLWNLTQRFKIKPVKSVKIIIKWAGASVLCLRAQETALLARNIYTNGHVFRQGSLPCPTQIYQKPDLEPLFVKHVPYHKFWPLTSLSVSSEVLPRLYPQHHFNSIQVASAIQRRNSPCLARTCEFNNTETLINVSVRGGEAPLDSSSKEITNIATCQPFPSNRLWMECVSVSETNCWKPIYIYRRCMNWG